MRRKMYAVFLVLMVMFPMAVSAQAEFDRSFFVAAATGDTTQLLEKVREGAQVNSVDPNGFTPLFVAAQQGQIESVKVLLENGAEVNMENSASSVALTAASQNGHTDVVSLLVASGALVDGLPMASQSPLYLAAGFGHLGVVEQLVDRGADINRLAVDGSSPLIVAIATNNSEVAIWLIERGANVDVRRPNDGAVAIGLAAESGNMLVTKAILATSPKDPNPINVRGQTASQIARVNKHDQIADLIEEAVADRN